MPFILLLISFSIFIYSQNENKRLTLHKTDAIIKIDGIIDDAWSEADSATNFFQFTPYYNQPPVYPTVAKLLTNDNSLFCLMICYDDRNSIQEITGTLDNFSGDVVSLMLDTFGDRRTGYKFAVSSTGVRADSRILDDNRQRDYTWDGIWFGDAKIYDWGFVVEMEIPYKSIQYDENLTEWGLDFDRWSPERKEDLYWCVYEENEGMRVSKFGKLILNEFRPTIKGLNLEIYPVVLGSSKYLGNGKYKFDTDGGLDIFYNPSQKLTYQLTINPDFAQIEADPFTFNISRYESFISERRPFFIQGKEIFLAAGRENRSGFYSPMELFYSRRIGKKLPDGKEVPLQLGTKAFGRIDDWEYGGFIAKTGEVDYEDKGKKLTEHSAYFGSARIKKQILDNSVIGVMFVGKQTNPNDGSKGTLNGVIDIDGAFRSTDWQLAYQFARSISNGDGDYAFSAGFTNFASGWMTLARTRYVGEKFDISQVGFVPWKGTTSFVAISGPRWYYENGTISSILLYGGGALTNEKVDNYTDYQAVLGFNMSFRSNWGFEINYSNGKSKDQNVKYNSSDISFSSWFNVSPKWNGNLWGGIQKTFNFRRNYSALYSWQSAWIEWTPLTFMRFGSEISNFVEYNPDGKVEDIFFNARPTITVTPINYLTLRLYVDNLYVKSTDKLESVIIGFLFSYNFLPKSWLYFAVNEFQNREEENNIRIMKTNARAAVLKVKYLYYF